MLSEGGQSGGVLGRPAGGRAQGWEWVCEDGGGNRCGETVSYLAADLLGFRLSGNAEGPHAQRPRCSGNGKMESNGLAIRS